MMEFRSVVSFVFAVLIMAVNVLKYHACVFLRTTLRKLMYLWKISMKPLHILNRLRENITTVLKTF